MNTIIRRASKGSDFDSVATIYNSYLGISTMDLERKEGQYYINLMGNGDKMEELWVMGEVDIICWGIIKKYSDRQGYRLTGETSVYCHPDYCGKGYGTTMKKHLMDRCRKLGYHHLLARINANNDVSIHYNEKLGYTLVGIQNEVGYVDGKWRDIAIMQCIL